MWRIAGRPLGVTMVALVVLLDAALSFMVAYTRIGSAPVDWSAAAVLGLIGMLLAIKAYSLRSYHRVAWLSVQALAGLGAAVDVVELLRGHAEPGTWLSVAWQVITLAYSNLPSIRALYVHHGEPAS